MGGLEMPHRPLLDDKVKSLKHHALVRTEGRSKSNVDSVKGHQSSTEGAAGGRINIIVDSMKGQGQGLGAEQWEHSKRNAESVRGQGNFGSVGRPPDS